MKFSFSKFKNVSFIVAAGLIALVFAFQNCSKMTNFAPTPTVVQASATEEGDIVDPNAVPLPKTCTFEGTVYNENEKVERFQFASVPNTGTCAKQIRKCKNGLFDGDYAYTTCSNTAAPNVMQLSLSHNSGYRSFTVSSIYLDVVGSQCKVQYEKNQLTWTDTVTPAFDCSADLNNLKIELPISNWNATFNPSAPIQVRLIKVSDNSVVGVFPQKLTCGARAASAVPTPDIDENCDGQWDDIVNGAKLCKFSIGNKSYGSQYSCPETAICEGLVATFNSMSSMNLSHFYKNASCTTVNFEDAYSYGAGADQIKSGTLSYPDANLFKPGCTKFNVDTPDDSANWVFASPSSWSHADCEYLYDRKTLYY